jgi:uncharacterized protein
MEIKLDVVSIETQEQHLEGSLMQPAQALPAILFVHGWGGSQSQDLQRARDAAALGTVCLTFDLRGHDRESPAFRSVTREQNLADLLAAYDWLSQRSNVDADAIAVVGVSYGGYLATILSALRPVRWLALRSPALYKDDGWQVPKLDLHTDPDLPAYRRRRIDWHENRAFRACAEFRGDVLIVEAENDDIVPHTVIENYIAAFGHAHSLTSRRIGGADHALSDEQAQIDYSTTLLKWLSEMILGGRKAAAKEQLDLHERNKAGGGEMEAA